MSYMRSPHYVYVSKTGDNDGHGTTWVNIDMSARMELAAFDELMVMRMAQLSQDEVKQAAERAVENHGGNIGCVELAKAMGRPGFHERMQDWYETSKETT